MYAYREKDGIKFYFTKRAGEYLGFVEDPEIRRFPKFDAKNGVMVLDQAAKKKSDLEAAWESLRADRNERLASSDWTQLADSPLKDDPDVSKYRQTLRDLPDSVKDPLAVVWPETPSALL